MLRRGIEAHFLPHLLQRGFKQLPLTGEDRKSRELQSCFPFGRHRRVAADGRFEMVEVQLDKRSAGFRLNLGLAPVGGVVRATLPIPQDEVWVHDLEVSYTLYRWPRFHSWFSLWLVPRQAGGTEATQGDFDALAGRVAQLLPEVDMLFAMNKRGRHIRKIDLR
jgi:hypothetical protein